AGTASHLAETTGAWGCGKSSAFPTSPHPPRRPRTIVQRGVTLTFHLVQKIGQATVASGGAAAVNLNPALVETPSFNFQPLGNGCRVNAWIMQPVSRRYIPHIVE